MPVVHSFASVLRTAGVLPGHGPSSKVSTTSWSRRKSSCLKCSKPKPGPPVVSISTVRPTPSALGLVQAARAGCAVAGAAAGAAAASGAAAAGAAAGAGAALGAAAACGAAAPLAAGGVCAQAAPDKRSEIELAKIYPAVMRMVCPLTYVPLRPRPCRRPGRSHPSQQYPSWTALANATDPTRLWLISTKRG